MQGCTLAQGGRKGNTGLSPTAIPKRELSPPAPHEQEVEAMVLYIKQPIEDKKERYGRIQKTI